MTYNRITLEWAKNMIKYRTASILIIFIIISALLSGCFCAPPIMGSRLYRPISDWEQREYDKANRYIYPDDVRSDIAKYQSTTIAWAGIIKDTEVTQTPEGPDIYYVLEHHYYDWIEDINPRQQWVWLSPRGEGTFITKWSVKKDTTQSEIDGMTKLGDLQIVYGTPQEVKDGVIAIEASYIRVIPQRYYTTDKLDYGRSTEPSNTGK